MKFDSLNQTLFSAGVTTEKTGQLKEEEQA